MVRDALVNSEDAMASETIAATDPEIVASEVNTRMRRGTTGSEEDSSSESSSEENLWSLEAPSYRRSMSGGIIKTPKPKDNKPKTGNKKSPSIG